MLRWTNRCLGVYLMEQHRIIPMGVGLFDIFLRYIPMKWYQVLGKEVTLELNFLRCGVFYGFLIERVYKCCILLGILRFS